MVSQKLHRGCPQPPQTYKGSIFCQWICVWERAQSKLMPFSTLPKLSFSIGPFAFPLCTASGLMNRTGLSSLKCPLHAAHVHSLRLKYAYHNLRLGELLALHTGSTPLRVSLLPTMSLDVGMVHLSTLSEPANNGIACPIWALTNLCVCLCTNACTCVCVQKLGRVRVAHEHAQGKTPESHYYYSESNSLLKYRCLLDVGGFWLISRVLQRLFLSTCSVLHSL